MQQGYIRLYRSMIDKGWSRKPDYVAVWVYILMRGSYKPQEIMLDGQILTIQPGQFVTSRKQMSINTGVHESKIQRILSLFEIEQQIEQQTKSKYRLISIVNWDKYQAREHQNEQQMNSKRTADEQQVNTDKEVKKERREEKPTAAWGDLLRKKADEKRSFILDKVCPWMDDDLFDIEVEKMVTFCKSRTTDPGLRVLTWFQKSRKPKGGLADNEPLKEKFTDRWKRGEI